MTDVADLRLRFRSDEANTATQRMDRLSGSASRAERSAGQLQRQSQGLAGAFRGLTRMIAPLAGALAAAFSVRGIGRTLQGLDEIAKQARSIDATANALRATQMAMTEAGVSAGETVSAMQRLNRELARGARGAGNSAEALGRLGLSISDLQGMDADERFATLADAVQDAGLNAGQTSDLLRDLGVRSREMALALVDGGDGIRQAREELQRLGLELDDVDLRAVEDANDALSRMGMVAQSFGQTIAITLAPALQAMAQSFSRLAGEGELFRQVAEGVGRVLSGWVTILTQAVNGISMLSNAFWGAEYAAMGLVAALVAVRIGLIRTGFGAIIVLAGELAFRLDRLIERTGSWGEALSALGDLARGVWEGIVSEAQAMSDRLGAVWQTIRATFFEMTADLVWEWSRAMGAIAEGARGAGFDGIADQFADLANAAGDASIDLSMAAGGARSAAENFRSSADNITTAGWGRASDALDRLRGITDETTQSAGALDNALMGLGGQSLRQAAMGAGELDDALASIGGGAGGGSGGGGGGSGAGGSAGAAADGIRGIGEAAEQTGQVMQTLQNGMANAFAQIVTGAQSAREALGQLLNQLANVLANSAFQALFGGLFGGGSPMSFSGWAGAGSVPVPSFAGGGFTGTGPRSGGMDGRGGFPAILHPNETVIDHTKGGGGGGNLNVTVTMDESTGRLGAFVRDEAGRVVSRAKPQIVSESVGAAVELNGEKRVFG